jgi:hypothetical protein
MMNVVFVMMILMMTVFRTVKEFGVVMLSWMNAEHVQERVSQRESVIVMGMWKILVVNVVVLVLTWMKMAYVMMWMIV